MTADDQFSGASNPYAPAGTQDLDARVDLTPDDSDYPFQPFRSIWFSPRRTIRQIIARDPTLHVMLLVALAGIGQSLDRASTRNAGDDLPMMAIIMMAVFLGPLSGVIGLLIGSALIRWTGAMISGTGTYEHIKTAIAWSSVPAVFSLPLWIPQLVMLGSEMFTSATPTLDANPILLIPFLGITFVEIVLGVWGMILLCNTIAEVQGYRSAWKGFGNLLLAGLVVIVPLLLLVFLLVGALSA